MKNIPFVLLVRTCHTKYFLLCVCWIRSVRK